MHGAPSVGRVGLQLPGVQADDPVPHLRSLSPHRDAGHHEMNVRIVTAYR